VEALEIDVADRASESRPGASSVIGRVERIDPEVGLHGWAYDVDDKGAPVEIELWAGTTLIAVTEANRFRSDLGSEGDPQLNPGFLFGVSVLKTAALNLAVAPDAALEVRVRGGSALDGVPVPTVAALLEVFEEQGSPPVETANLDLRGALDALTAEARILRKRPLRPVADAIRGYIEHAALLDRNTIAIAGWINRDVDLDQAAVVLDGEKYEAAFSLAAYDRSDLPDYAQAFVGVIQTAWRPRAKGSEPFVFFGPNSEFHLRSVSPLLLRPLRELQAPLERIPTVGGHSRLLELRQLLLAGEGWTPRGDSGSALGVAMSVDRAILLPGFGALIEGWALTGPHRLAGMAVRLGATVLDLDPGSLRRRPRSDLIKAYPVLKDGAHSAGFVGLFVGPLREGDLTDPMFRLQFANGATATIALNPGAFTPLDAGFDIDQLRQLYPSLALEPRFPQLAAARSEMVKRTLAGSAHAVLRARADRLMILALPPSDHDLMLVLEGAARNVAGLGPGTALALVGQPNQNRERILPWLNALRARSGGAEVSFTLIETVDHAIYAVDALLRAHKASSFAFVGPHVWLTDQGWGDLVAALAVQDFTQAEGPAYLPVRGPLHKPFDAVRDDELFVWSDGPYRRWLAAAPATFDDCADDRGLPDGEFASSTATAAMRLRPSGQSTFKAGLDKAVLATPASPLKALHA
jgi:hypothetical protein